MISFPWCRGDRPVAPTAKWGKNRSINCVWCQTWKPPPNWGYSFLSVLRQWGQQVTISLTLYLFRVSIFSLARDWNPNSLPTLLKGSPLHLSSLPRMAKSTPTLCKNPAKALTTLWFLSSKAPAQPTQNSRGTARRAPTLRKTFFPPPPPPPPLFFSL